LVGIVENLLMLGEEMIVMWANNNLRFLQFSGVTPWKIAENGTLKWGSSPPRAEMPTFKWLFLNNLRSTTEMLFPASLFRAP